MPCRCDYQEPTAREQESVKVLEFLHEVGIKTESPTTYGNVEKLNEDTAELCYWCKTNDVTGKSLELQIWWRDHQRADKKRTFDEMSAKLEARIKQRALDKLSSYEKDLLGL